MRRKGFTLIEMLTVANPTITSAGEGEPACR
jgi:hypothetical protein